MKIKIADIIIPKDRIREFKGRDATNSAHPAFQSLVDSIREQGLLQAILVAPHEAATQEFRERWVLVAGRHRLEAHIDLGLDEIEATVMENENEDEEVRGYERQLVEIAENLSRVELSDAEHVVHIAEYRRISAANAARRKQLEDLKLKAETAAAAKAIKDKKSPEYKAALIAQRNASRNARCINSAQNLRSNDTNDEDEPAPLKFPRKAAQTSRKDTETKFGLSKRTVEAATEVTNKIGTGDMRKLSGTTLDAGGEIKALAKLPMQKRKELVKAVTNGKAVSARAELAIIERERAETDKDAAMKTVTGAYKITASALSSTVGAINKALEGATGTKNQDLIKRLKKLATEADALLTMAKQGAANS